MSIRGRELSAMQGPPFIVGGDVSTHLRGDIIFADGSKIVGCIRQIGYSMKGGGHYAVVEAGGGTLNINVNEIAEFYLDPPE